MEETESCLVRKLSHYKPLNEHSRALLRELEKDERDYPKHCDIHDVTSDGRFLFVVKSGWLYSHVDIADGRRQIVKIHHPGDVIGLPDLAFDGPNWNLRTCEQVRLCPFPREGLNDIFRTAPQLTALLFALSLRDQIVLVDGLTALGRMTARERIAYLLLDLLARLRITNKQLTNTFRLPLTQSEIGDTLGLSNVFVSKSFTALEKDGYVKRAGAMITLLRENDLAEMVEFKNRYQEMDTSWFPEA